MNLKTFEITISPKGDVQVQTKGFAGSSCRDASKALEEALGVKGREQMTAEHFSPVRAEQQAQTGA